MVRLVGGPLGGILLALCGARWLIVIDTASYLLSALALVLTSRTGAAAAGAGRTTPGAVARDLLEGTRVLCRQSVARALFPVTVVYLAANASLSAVLIVFGIQRLGGSEPTGFLLAGLGVGFLAGAPVIRLLLDRVPAPDPAGRHADRHRRRLRRPVHLVLAGRGAARGGRRRHVRLDVAGNPADHHAAGGAQRGPRPDRRRLPRR